MLNRHALTALRIKSRLTQTTLACFAEISVQYLNDLEAGRRKGTKPDVIGRLADALDVPLEAGTRSSTTSTSPARQPRPA